MLIWTRVSARMRVRRRGLYGFWHSGLGVYLGLAMALVGLLFASWQYLFPTSPLVFILAWATASSALTFLLDMIVATIWIVRHGEPEERLRNDPKPSSQ